MRYTVKAVQVVGSKVVATREWQELTAVERDDLVAKLYAAGWYVQVS